MVEVDDEVALPRAKKSVVAGLGFSKAAPGHARRFSMHASAQVCGMLVISRRGMLFGLGLGLQCGRNYRNPPRTPWSKLTTKLRRNPPTPVQKKSVDSGRIRRGMQGAGAVRAGLVVRIGAGCAVWQRLPQCQRANMLTAVGFEPTPLRTGA
jgi:hypothetical protein